ncbi:MAG: methyltransferase domain-containing protein, partial [Candidatus Eisenbacteria bacterium]|nr:methyltransferase domain-containing protein [Candidatus Eisenbacteria bacterium]
MRPAEYQRMYEVEETFWWYRGLRRIVLNLVRPHLPPRRPLEVLDAGCGTGGFLPEAARLGRVRGLDVSPAALELARRRAAAELVAGGVEQLPFAEDAFDLILSMDVLYHRAVADDRAGLSEMTRCLRPGGILVLNLPAYDWLRSRHDAAIHTARRYTRRRVAGLMRGLPLETLRSTHWNSLLFPAAAVRRLVERRSAGASDVQPLPPWLNRCLESVLRIEAGLVSRIDLPYGLSVAVVA